MEPSQTVEVSKRDDPRYDARRVVVYFVGLIAFYAGVVAVMRPDEGEISKVALGIMFAPTVGAIAAVLFAHGRIQFGRLSKHIFLAFLPPLVILATAWAASVFTDVTVHPENLLMVVVLSPVFALGGALSAIGEEIGWRGFLWPLFRRRMRFWISSLDDAADLVALPPAPGAVLEATARSADCWPSPWRSPASSCSSACSRTDRGPYGPACLRTARGTGWWPRPTSYR